MLTVLKNLLRNSECRVPVRYVSHSYWATRPDEVIEKGGVETYFTSATCK